MGEAGLRDVARALPREVLAGENHRPRHPAQEARDGAQQRRLAGAVGTEQRDDLTGADGEIDAVQHADLAIAGGEPTQGEEGLSRRDRH